MCGIVGLISKKAGGLYSSDLDMFQAMLVNDSQRGEDSTGVAMIERSGGVETLKIASHPFHLMATESWNKLRSKAIQSGVALIGHNRKATQGAINSANAHPFIEGDIVLVHNGTLRNHHSMKTGKEVDSHAICHAFNEKGHEEVIPTLNGAFALVWYNLKTEKLYMIRNEERPLSIVSTKDMMAFASESWMAWGQFARKNEKIEENFQLDKGVLYEINPRTGERTTKKLELYVEPPVTVQRYHGGHYGRWGSDEWEDLESGILVTKGAHYTGATNDAGKDCGDDCDKDGNTRHPFRGTPVARGELVQVEFDRIAMELCYSRGSILSPKAYGKLMNSNGDVVDAVGWLNQNLTPSTWGVYLNAPMTAIVDYVTNSTCGTSAWVKDIEFDDELPTHSGKVGEFTWKYYVSGSPCSKCKEEIDSRDHFFTSVKPTKSGLRVHCATCVIDSLPQGDMKDAFITRRNAALQARKPVSQEPSATANNVIQLPGPAALQ